MNIKKDQLPGYLLDCISKQIEIYNDGQSITVYNEIPDTSEIPIKNPNYLQYSGELNNHFS